MELDIEVPQGTPDELAAMIRGYRSLIARLNSKCGDSNNTVEFRALGGGEYCDLDCEVELGVTAKSGSSWWLHFYRAEGIPTLINESDDGVFFPDPKVHMVIVKDCHEDTLFLATERFLAQYAVDRS